MSWLLDSGATNHMTGSKDLVVDVHPIPSMPTHVQFGDASTSKVLGLGEVVISQDLTIEKVILVESTSAPWMVLVINVNISLVGLMLLPSMFQISSTMEWHGLKDVGTPSRC